jgi:hypothetical protein
VVLFVWLFLVLCGAVGARALARESERERERERER